MEEQGALFDEAATTDQPFGSPPEEQAVALEDPALEPQEPADPEAAQEELEVSEGVQKRINELTYQRHEADRQRDTAYEKMAEMEVRLKNLEQPQGQAVQQEDTLEYWEEMATREEYQEDPVAQRLINKKIIALTVKQEVGAITANQQLSAAQGQSYQSILAQHPQYTPGTPDYASAKKIFESNPALMSDPNGPATAVHIHLGQQAANVQSAESAQKASETKLKQEQRKTQLEPGNTTSPKPKSKTSKKRQEAMKQAKKGDIHDELMYRLSLKE